MNGGFPEHYEKIDVGMADTLHFKDITYVSPEMGFEGVDIIVPVF